MYHFMSIFFLFSVLRLTPHRAIHINYFYLIYDPKPFSSSGHDLPTNPDIRHQRVALSSSNVSALFAVRIRIQVVFYGYVYYG